MLCKERRAPVPDHCPKQLTMYAGHRNESCLLLYIGIESLKIGELKKVGGKECESLVGGRKGGAEGREEGEAEKEEKKEEGLVC